MSNNDEPATVVVFRRFPKKHGGDVIALFPLIPETRPGTCGSYQHIGQHGAADLALTYRTRPADVTEPDVAALKRELEGAPFHYRLDVRRRLPHWRRIEAARREAGV